MLDEPGFWPDAPPDAPEPDAPEPEPAAAAAAAAAAATAALWAELEPGMVRVLWGSVEVLELGPLPPPEVPPPPPLAPLDAPPAPPPPLAPVAVPMLLPAALMDGGPEESEAEPDAELVRLLRPAWARVSACCCCLASSVM